MNPKSTVHELDRLLREIRNYHITMPRYYQAMMGHLHFMCILTWLEFGSKTMKAETMIDLIKIMKSSKRQSE